MSEQGTPNPPILVTIGPEPQDRAAHIPGLQILQPLCEGSVGTLYQARREETEDIVAVKLLHSFFSIHPGDPFHVERLMLTLLRVQRLRHPAILPILEYGTFSPRPAERPDRVFVVMERIDGGSLQHFLDADSDLDLRSADEVIATALSIGTALEHAHQHGVLHTALKPENVFVSRDADGRLRVRVSDFALAGIIRANAGPLEGEAIWGFLAPELFDNHLSDERADLYSAGAVFSRVLKATDFNDDPRIAALTRIAERCMMLEPSERFEEAGELVAALRRLEGRSEGPPVIAPVIPGIAPVIPVISGVVPPPLSRALLKPPRRRLWLAVLGAVLLLIGVLTVPRLFQAQTRPAPVAEPMAASMLLAPTPEPIPELPIDVTATLTTSPGGAEVWEDGRRLGSTPLLVIGPPDSLRTLEVRAAGFKPMVLEWRLEQGSREVVLLSLLPVEPVLLVASSIESPEATVVDLVETVGPSVREEDTGLKVSEPPEPESPPVEAALIATEAFLDGKSR